MSKDRIFKSLATILVVGVAGWIIWYLWEVVLYILVAAVLSLVGRPLVSYLTRINILGHSLSRTLAAALTLVVMWLVIGALGMLFIPLLYGKVNELASMDWTSVTAVVESSLMNLEGLIERVFAIEITDIGETFKQFMLSLVDIDVAKTFASVATVIKGVAISFFSISFITFYFMKEDNLFYRLVALFFPDRFRSNVYNALDSITALLSRYFGGLMAESFMLMVIISVVMTLFGMHGSDALVIGLIIGVLNVIPYAGPVIGTLLSLCIALLSPIGGDVLHTAIVLCSTVVVVKVIDDFIIQPTIYSDRVQAHPLEVFLCILIAGYIGGIWGMLFAIPLYTVLRVFAREFFSEYSLVQKLTHQMTD
ncbi:MAG: AI-2E family transporter [Alistipes sp.]|nr:AI-2E family transporter [Alistipes sp.]